MKVGNGKRNEKSVGLADDCLPLAFLVAVAVLYFLPVLLKGNAVVLSKEGTDTWSEFFYWRHFGFGSLARGEIPLWNPHVFSGFPFVAGNQSAIFYPPNMLYLFFATPLAINLSIALHCLLASLFTYLFARYMRIARAGSVLSGVTFAYGAPYFLHIYPGHLSNLSTMVWLPLVLMGIEAFLRNGRIRYAVMSGIPLSIQVLAGHAQYVFYSAVAVTLYFVFGFLLRRKFKDIPYFLVGFCLFVITAISLSAIQFFPALELTRYSVRVGLSYELVSTFSFSPSSLITLLLPHFFGDERLYWGQPFLWEMSVYLGVLPIAFAAAGIFNERSRSALSFTMIAAIALVLAFGKHTPLLRVLYVYVPGFDLFRGLSKFVFVVSFACSMLAGYGLTRMTALARQASPTVRWFSYSLCAVSLIHLFVFYGLTIWPWHWSRIVEGVAKTWDQAFFAPPTLTEWFLHESLAVALKSSLKTSLLLAALGASLLVLSKIKRLPTGLWVVFVLGLTVWDLWHFGSRYLVSFKPETVSLDRELKSFLKQDTGRFRVTTPWSLLNSGMLEGSENVGGDDATALKNYIEFINFTQESPIDGPRIGVNIRQASPLLRLLNLKYYIVDSGGSMSQDPSEFPVVFQNARYKVFRDDGALPRSFIVHDVQVLNGREAILRGMASPTFDPISSAIIEEAVEGLPSNPRVQSPVPTILEHSPRKVVIEADPKEAGLLLLGDAYYPGWKVFVDGRETKMLRANHVMRGVILSKGQHRVEFRYDPVSFKAGAITSLASLVLVAGFFLWSRA